MSLPEAALPEAVATVSGRLTTIGGDPIGAQIQWINLENGQLVQTTTSDPTNGSFFATLPSLGQYSYTIKKEGYFPVSGNLDFSESLYHHRLDKEMTVVSVEEMKEKDLAITLNNLFFDTGKFDIKPTSYPELNTLAEWVTENKLSIAVHGHTDHVGDDDANQLLSENRAREVRKYLISRGLSEDQIISEGFGESRPVATNDTDQGRAMNRRVEIRIVER
jgi:outer membrane protein OmpA-like peptidoglycan-associated protein